MVYSPRETGKWKFYVLVLRCTRSRNTANGVYGGQSPTIAASASPLIDDGHDQRGTRHDHRRNLASRDDVKDRRSSNAANRSMGSL
jgi:hypothetical protein